MLLIPPIVMMHLLSADRSLIEHEAIVLVNLNLNPNIRQLKLLHHISVLKEQVTEIKLECNHGISATDNQMGIESAADGEEAVKEGILEDWRLNVFTCLVEEGRDLADVGIVVFY